MGLQLCGIVENNLAAGEGLRRGIVLAAGAFVLLLVVRAVYVFPLLGLHDVLTRRAAVRRLSEGSSARSAARAGRRRADIDYFDASPLTWKHNAIVVWAGMRGAVTLAAAQTLPQDAPERDLLIFVAFLVAAGSLLIQGLTLPALARALGLRRDGASSVPRDEVRAIDAELRAAAEEAAAAGTLRRGDRSRFSDDISSVPASRFAMPLDPTDGLDAPEAFEFELALIAVMRSRLHELGRSGRHSTGALRYVLDELDAYEISVKLHWESEK